MSRLKGPEMLVRVMRMRDCKDWHTYRILSDVNSLSETLMIREVQHHLLEGKTSLFDISPNGTTLLHVGHNPFHMLQAKLASR